MLTPELKQYLKTLWEKYPEPILESNDNSMDIACKKADRLANIMTDLTNKAKELYGTNS